MEAIRDKKYIERVDNWIDIRKTLRPLDLVFMRGCSMYSNLISVLEKKTTGNGDFTHVGIVITNEILPDLNLKPESLYIWESTISMKRGPASVNGIVDEVTGKGYFGVHLRNLDMLIKSSIELQKDSRISIGILKDNPWNDESLRQWIVSKFKSIYTSLNHTRYDMRPVSILGAIIPCMRPVRSYFVSLDDDNLFSDKLPTDNLLFCSELIASTYQKLGILDPEIDPSNVLPVDLLGYDADAEIDCIITELIHIFNINESN